MTYRVEITIPGVYYSDFPHFDQRTMEMHIRRARPDYISGKNHIRICWFEGAERRPIDEIAEARGALLRALKAKHVLRTYAAESMSGSSPITEYFFIDEKNPRIEVTIISADAPAAERERFLKEETVLG